MPVVALEPDRHDDADEDHFEVLRDVSWSDYLRTLRERGAHSAPRICYLEGQLQIMSPGQSHERIKWLIGHLIAIWCEERDIEFDALGSWTVKERKVARGVEPDECFIIGPSRKARRPDLAIEVIWTSGSVDKLEIYRLLNVREVWIWRRGDLTAHVLRGEMYEPASESLLLPGIDLRHLACVLDQPSTSGAIRAYRDLLRKQRSG